MNEYQAAVDVDAGINQPDLEPKPILWDKRSWSQDAADYILPDSDDDMAELGDIIRSALLSSEINIIGKATVGGAVSVSFWCSRIGEIVLQAAIDNELKYDALSGLKS